MFKGAKITKTSLYNSHLKLNAKMVSFAGYDMPITYKKIGRAIQFLELDLLAWIHFKKSWAELGVNERKVVFDYEQ